VNWWLFWFFFGVKKKSNGEQQSIHGTINVVLWLSVLHVTRQIYKHPLGGNLVAEQNTVSKTK